MKDAGKWMSNMTPRILSHHTSPCDLAHLEDTRLQSNVHSGVISKLFWEIVLKS